MNKTLEITTARGIPMTIVLLETGVASERTPGWSGITFGQPVLEFYDARYDFTQYGQFAGDYYASSLFARPAGSILMLETSIDDWTVDAGTLRTILAWAQAQASS
jgi:hypothetical protein